MSTIWYVTEDGDDKLSRENMIKLFIVGSSSSNKAPGKFKKLGTSDWLKLTFLDEKCHKVHELHFCRYCNLNAINCIYSKTFGDFS